MSKQEKPHYNFKFGDLIENHYASEDNPIRIGIFVKKSSKGNFEMTNGKGKFWLGAYDNDKLVKIGSVIHNIPVPTIKPGDKKEYEDSIQYVLNGIKSCLPEGVPVPFKVLESRFKGKRAAIAKVELFDGQQGLIQISKWADTEQAWSMFWIELDGGSINWNGAEWERIIEEDLGGSKG